MALRKDVAKDTATPRHTEGRKVGTDKMKKSSLQSVYSLAGWSDERVRDEKIRILHPDIPSRRDALVNAFCLALDKWDLGFNAHGVY